MFIAIAMILLVVDGPGLDPDGFLQEQLNNWDDIVSLVFLLEPWWNPAVELQAVHRAYRIGQKRAVHATRFITKGTIEERMHEIQKSKQLVFEGTVDGKNQAIEKLTQEDLEFLFKN